MSTFEDSRGVIRDLFEGDDEAVTSITTVKDAVRGNHFHKLTTQWTLVVSGELLMRNGDTETFVRPGEASVHEPGEPHAWRALEDTECLVYTRGPRSGSNYESDTYRLDEPLL